MLINVVYGQYYQGDEYYDYYNLNDLNDSYYGDTYYGDAYNPTYDYDVYADINGTSIENATDYVYEDMSTNETDYVYDPEYYDIYGDVNGTEMANDAVIVDELDEVEEVEEVEGVDSWIETLDGDLDGLDDLARSRWGNKNIESIISQAQKYWWTTQATTPSTTVATTAATTAATYTAATAEWKCWHCDESSLELCYANGAEKSCHQGDYGSCMLEVTEQNGRFRNICMGCKQVDACQNAMAENFWDYLPENVANARYARPDPYDRFTTCKPEDDYNSSGSRSYCRQCCYTSNCFGFDGYTDSSGNVTPWSDVIAWDRVQWKLGL